jgi:hydrogenase maturation protease
LHYTEYLLSDIAILLKGCIAKGQEDHFERNTKSIMQTARPGCWNSALPSGFHFHLPRALACGNTLRGDDGVGPFLAAWAEQRFASDSSIRVISRQQRTPDLAEDIAHAESVLFIDCSVESAPGSINLRPVHQSAPQQGLATHHQGAAELLSLTRELYDSLPKNAQLLTIGAGAMALSENFSEPVTAALPHACRLIEETVLRLITASNLPV